MALAMIGARQRDFACFALRLDVPLPPDIATTGFDLGHSLVGTAHFEAIQFAFAFADFGTYNVLLNPNNACVQAVVDHMRTHGGYFILIIGSAGEATVFRAELGSSVLSGLKTNRARIRASSTRAGQYAALVAQFRQRPSPPGQLLEWVCRDDTTALRPRADPLILSPTGR